MDTTHVYWQKNRTNISTKIKLSIILYSIAAYNIEKKFTACIRIQPKDNFHMFIVLMSFVLQFSI